jgi:fructokinase
MTSVEQSRQIPSIVCIGESLWDDIDDQCLPGGAPSNVASHLSQLGLTCRLLSRLGDDSAGKRLANVMRARKVDTSLVQIDGAHPTCMVSVERRSDGTSSFGIRDGVSWDYFEPDSRWTDIVEHAGIIYFGTLAMRTESSRIVMQNLLEAARDKIRFCDINLRSPHFEEPIIQKCLELTDVLKVNAEELNILAQIFYLDESFPSSCATQLMKRFGIQRVFVSLDSNGSMVISEDGEFIQAPQKAEAIDSTGAGDAYTSGIIYGLAHRWPLRKSAYFASILGARVVEQPGPNSLSHDDYANALSRANFDEDLQSTRHYDRE